MNLDFRGYIFKYIRLVFERFRLGYSFIIVSIIFPLKGIKYGKRCKFYGVPLIIRYPGSKISIGNACTFRSDKTVNLASKKRIVIKTFAKSAEIQIGNNVGMNGTAINCLRNVTIQDETLLGFNVTITDTDYHHVDPVLRRSAIPESIPVLVGKNSWLGANVMILKGVSIGKNSVIGANSVVLSDIPHDVIALGNPCRVMKKL